jgi:hypothetical protein
MASIDFKKGTPLKLRATTQIHLGKVEKYINAGDIVEFDGQTLDLGGGEVHNIPQLRGAVLSGWLVPEADITSVYTPQPADIRIRPALSADKERGEYMKVEKVEHEERVVGTIGQSAKSPNTGMDSGASGEGVPVGRIMTPAVQTPIVKDSASAAREASRLDSTTPPKVEATATGDVDQPIIGETLIDILPNAASPGRVIATKTAGGKSVMLSNGDVWDMGRHWRTRARDALRKYSGDTAGMNAVRAVEVPSVHKFIDGRVNK